MPALARTLRPQPRRSRADRQRLIGVMALDTCRVATVQSRRFRGGRPPPILTAASDGLPDLGRCAVIIYLRAAPCRDESRDRAGANRSPESFINDLVFTLKGLTLAR